MQRSPSQTAPIGNGSPHSPAAFHIGERFRWPIMHAGTAAEAEKNRKHEKASEKARKQAEKDLTQSWMDRLQLISVIATFFASTEAGMLQLTTPHSGVESSTTSLLANATFLGALVLHIWAAIISFLAAFSLVRYNLLEAKQEWKSSTTDLTAPSPEVEDAQVEAAQGPLWNNPHIEEVGPFRSKPPTHLLRGCHNLCVLLTFGGFGLALVGILGFAWGQSTVSAGVVASACTGICVGGAVWVFVHY